MIYVIDELNGIKTFEKDKDFFKYYNNTNDMSIKKVLSSKSIYNIKDFFKDKNNNIFVFNDNGFSAINIEDYNDYYMLVKKHTIKIFNDKYIEYHFLNITNNNVFQLLLKYVPKNKQENNTFQDVEPVDIDIPKKRGRKKIL